MFPEDDEHANSHQLGLDPDTSVLVHSFWHSELFFTLCALLHGFGCHVLVQDMQYLLLLLFLPFWFLRSVTALSTAGLLVGVICGLLCSLKVQYSLTTWGSQGNHFHMRASTEGLEGSSCRPRHTNCREWEQTHLSMQHSTAFWCSPER